MISIVVDSKIQDFEKNLKNFSQTQFSIRYFESDKLQQSDIKNADALIVRSNVNVNEELCGSSELKFVGSASAGTNHLDKEFLNKSNIAWFNSSGSNACSVSHYVMAAIGELIKDGLFNPRETVGIIGYGNVGKRIYQLLAALNIKVCACDPFLSDSHLISLDQIFDCDLITVHTPYSEDGKYPTKNLINALHQKKLKNKILINTSRGGIISEDMILDVDDLIYLSDVWSDEPNPSCEVIKNTFIATPHIAGYSIEAKSNSSFIIAKECVKFFGFFDNAYENKVNLKVWPFDIKKIVADLHAHGFPVSLFTEELNLQSISKEFKALDGGNMPANFKLMRLNHSARHDFNAYSYPDLSRLDDELNLEIFELFKKI